MTTPTSDPSTIPDLPASPHAAPSTTTEITPLHTPRFDDRAKVAALLIATTAVDATLAYRRSRHNPRHLAHLTRHSALFALIGAPLSYRLAQNRLDAARRNDRPPTPSRRLAADRNLITLKVAGVVCTAVATSVVVHHRTELSPRRARVLLVTRTALMAPAVIYALTLLYPPPPLFTMPDSPGYSDLPDPDDNPAHVHQSDQKSPTTPAEHTSPADQPPAPAPPAASEDET